MSELKCKGKGLNCSICKYKNECKDCKETNISIALNRFQESVLNMSTSSISAIHENMKNNLLATFTTKELMRELRRRGKTVGKKRGKIGKEG